MEKEQNRAKGSGEMWLFKGLPHPKSLSTVERDLKDYLIASPLLQSKMKKGNLLGLKPFN
jgi:hypothetical protein